MPVFLAVGHQEDAAPCCCCQDDRERMESMHAKHWEERAKSEKNNKVIPEKNKTERKMNGMSSEDIEIEKREDLEMEDGKNFCKTGFSLCLG